MVYLEGAVMHLEGAVMYLEGALPVNWALEGGKRGGGRLCELYPPQHTLHGMTLCPNIYAFYVAGQYTTFCVFLKICLNKH